MTDLIPPHRSKGRPRTFDREAALEKALGVFWRSGYEPASMNELCAAMGITAPSLYAAFGNKAQLFMEAVQHYEDLYWNDVWDGMASEPDLHRALAAFFLETARVLTSQNAPCGCMVVLGAANVGPESEAIHEALRVLRNEGRTCFLERLKRGVAEGHLPSGADVEALASTLNTVLEGMSIQARDGIGREELERVASTAMRILPPPPKARGRRRNVVGAAGVGESEVEGWKA